MKQLRKRLTRLLSAGTALALLAGMLPGALAATSDLSYSVAADDVLEIEDVDLNNYCKSETGDGMDYIIFTDLPASNRGELYYLDGKDNELTIRENNRIYYSQLYYLVFEPDEDYTGTLYIPFEGLSDDGTYYDGELKIRVTAASGTSSSSADGEVTYEIATNEELVLSVDDFDQCAYDATPKGQTIKNIRFTDLPSSSKGVLYYRYGTKYEEKASANYLYDADEIDLLSFVPARNYSGTVTLPFTGRADSNETFTAELVIEVGGGGSSSSSSGGDIVYEIEVNDTQDLDVEDFDAYVFAETPAGVKVNYLQFTDLPSSSKGVLYYDYGGKNETKVSENSRYSSAYIDMMTFVPAKNYEGSVTLPFTGKADSGETFTGDLVIWVGETAGDVTIDLQTSSGSSLAFQASTFNSACLEETGANLTYVTFRFTAGRGGYLYYKYGQTGQSMVGSEKYYRSSTPSLDDVTFVAGVGTSDTVTIPFTGKADNGRSFNGEVNITFSVLDEPDTILYTTSGKAVDFSAVDFVKACAARGGQLLVSVRFLSPSMSGGQLYYGFDGPAKYQNKVIAGVQYSLVGTYQLGEVSFLPKAGYSGLVSIPYLGTDAAGLSFSGTVNVLVTAPTASRFNDMASYSWAIPAVEFLADYGITTGSGTGTTFSPLSKMTRGDYILMLCRSFGFTSTQTTSISDVPAGSYYASALAAAKTLGIAVADSSGKFRPTDPVTREDSMVFLYRALKAANRGVADASDTVLAQFSDSTSVSASARTAVAAMVQAGVIVGDGGGRLNPQGTLTRAEMATILYRALTL